ncbi:Uncharacterized protein TCM_000536 [Theobroma cacao]|uniref:Uncharacterized protein n=1 Tax=Theobroma cacao TaxID=3641 RepID=A0A061DHN1_THECC|nr:Uncharacterized protein TCM_000536 [Theobroma cacao]
MNFRRGVAPVQKTKELRNRVWQHSENINAPNNICRMGKHKHNERNYSPNLRTWGNKKSIAESPRSQNEQSA